MLNIEVIDHYDWQGWHGFRVVFFQ